MKIIQQEWRRREISDDDVVNDLVHSRAPGAGAALRDVDLVIARARTVSSTSGIE